MSGVPIQVTPPSGDVVAVDLAKLQMAITWTEDDALIAAYLNAAADHLDGPNGLLGRFLLDQVWSVTLDCVDLPILRLPFVDVSSVSITYRDLLEVEQTIDPAFYTVTADPQSAIIVFHNDFVTPEHSEKPEPFKVTMNVGYGTDSDVPHAIKVAIMMMVSQWFSNRDGVSEVTNQIPAGVDRLIQNYRVLKL